MDSLLGIIAVFAFGHCFAMPVIDWLSQRWAK